MKNFKDAFTMIEIVFVIVILGILAAIAVPKFVATRTDAEVAKVRSDVSAVRSAIMSERQSRLIRGEVNYISQLDNSVATNQEDQPLFDTNDSSGKYRLLNYPIITTKESDNKPTSGHWIKVGTNKYAVNTGGERVVFTYYPVQTNTSGYVHAAGSFDCIVKAPLSDTANASCLLLTR
jgi:general secretion pathway protein G